MLKAEDKSSEQQEKSSVNQHCGNLSGLTHVFYTEIRTICTSQDYSSFVHIYAT